MKVMFEFTVTRQQLESLDSNPPADATALRLLRQIAESIPLDGPPEPISTVLEFMRALAVRGSVTELQAFYNVLSLPHRVHTMTVETYDMPRNMTRAILLRLSIHETERSTAPPADIGFPISAPAEPRRPALGGMSMRRRRG